MDKNKATLAIYGIQDRFDYEHPFYVHDHNLAVITSYSIHYTKLYDRQSVGFYEKQSLERVTFFNTSDNCNSDSVC